MRFILKREPSEKTYTHGKLYAVNEYDGKEAFLCHTLEDVVRDAGVKIHGQTAIPKGTYELIVSFSNRFKKRLPLLLNVPNFEGIRIHGGNRAGLETLYKKTPINTLRDVLYSDEYIEVYDDEKNK